MTSPEILNLQPEEAKAGVLATSTPIKIRQLHGSKGRERSSRSRSSHHRKSSRSGRERSSRSRSSHHRSSSRSGRERSSRSRSSHHRSSSRSGRESSEKARSRSSRHRGNSSQRTPSLSSSRNGSSSGVKTSMGRSSSHRSSRGGSADRGTLRTSSVGRRNKGNGGSRSNERRRRKNDPLSVSSHAKLGGGSSHRRDNGSHKRHSKDKPPSRSNSLDSMLSIGTMDVLSEDDELKIFSSGDDDILARKGKEHSKYASIPSGSKRKKSSRGSSSPSSSHPKNSSALSTLNGSDTDAKAKAKAKASRGSSASAITGSSLNSASKLMYGSDADAKASKLLVEECWSSHSSDDDDDDGTILSPADIANAHIKARAAESRSQNDQKEQSNHPNFSSVSNTTALADKSNNAIGLLHGSNSDAKAKHRSARGSNITALVANTHDSVRLLYGSNADAEAKRSASERSTTAADPDPESLMPAAFLVDPVAMSSASTASTGSVSGRISDPQPSSRMISHAVSEAAGPEQPNNPEAESSLPDHGVPNTRKKSRKKQKEEAPQKSTKTWIALFLLFLFLIGGGIAIWRFLFKNKGEDQESSSFQDPSSAPSVASSDIDTWPTSPSFLEDLLYPPPSEDDCKAIARNVTIAGREEMFQADYGLGLEVVLSGNIKMTQFLLDELLDAIQEKILPSLAGCHILVDEFKEAWRFVIFDAFVNGNLQRGESCMDDENLAARNCHLVSVKVNLFLKGLVRGLEIIQLISDEEVNIRNHLGLSTVFSIVKLVQINSLTSSASPTIMPTPTLTSIPTNVPSTGPSALPTATPSSWPTMAPVVGPTPPPTPYPTPIPTPDPTASPTLAPTPPPTPNPTTPPTAPPTLNPTPAPIPNLTQIPSSVPSPGPTELTSSVPSSRPTDRPSPVPSAGPTVLPSPVPQPTPNPTPPPTPQPTPNPTPAPTDSGLQQLGENCLRDIGCESGNCSWTFKCEPLREIGQSCSESDDCVSGRCSWLFRCY